MDSTRAVGLRHRTDRPVPACLKGVSNDPRKAESSNVEVLEETCSEVQVVEVAEVLGDWGKAQVEGIITNLTFEKSLLVQGYLKSTPRLYPTWTSCLGRQRYSHKSPDHQRDIHGRREMDPDTKEPIHLVEQQRKTKKMGLMRR